jgi:hypothetical protein
MTKFDFFIFISANKNSQAIRVQAILFRGESAGDFNEQKSLDKTIYDHRNKLLLLNLNLGFSILL